MKGKTSHRIGRSFICYSSISVMSIFVVIFILDGMGEYETGISLISTGSGS